MKILITDDEREIRKILRITTLLGNVKKDALTADIGLQNLDLIICVSATCGRVVKNKVSHTFSPFIDTKGILTLWLTFFNLFRLLFTFY